jgi:hypothetical protein
MAVVFISPKQKQKTFFMGITVVFLLFLFVLSLGVFLSKPKEIPITMVFNKPKINIDMQVFDTEQFKGLEPFTKMELQFVYEVRRREEDPIKGFLSANSLEEARKILESLGFSILTIKEADIGRENPFTPYGQLNQIIDFEQEDDN